MVIFNEIPTLIIIIGGLIVITSIYLLSRLDWLKMNINNKIKIILINIFLFFIAADANASKIIVASTTSTYDTGLLNL